MKIIVGLGNIGKQYEHTVHNMGFDCVDRVAEKLGITQPTVNRWMKGECEPNFSKLLSLNNHCL